jgi:glucose/mannose-6-phosphate isomerase
MISLDDTVALSRLDRAGMLLHLDGFPAQCREGWELGRAWSRVAGPTKPAALVIAGMGGSAMAGDLVRGLLSRELSFPVAVVRDYELPGWVGADATVVCCSYSGETEETLSAYRDASARGAKILIAASGGTLGEEASAKGLPRLTVPPGLPPRAALGYSLFGLLGLVGGWREIDSLERDAEESFTALEKARKRLGPEVPEEKNEAKELARSIVSCLPVICAPDGHLGAVGFRWRTQLNENSKMSVYNCLFPELDHNEIVGWAEPFNVKKAIAIFLRDGAESGRVRLRVDITRELFERSGLPVREVRGDVGSRLGDMAALTYLGDFVSVYAAFLRGFDPTPVDVIGLLKKRLSEGK